MIIEFLIQHPVLIAGIVSVFIFLYTFRMFRRTVKEEYNDGLITRRNAQGYTERYNPKYFREEGDKLVFTDEYAKENEYASVWNGVSGSVASFQEWEMTSGTVINIDEFNPYKHPVMKEHEVVRCKYCKRQNKATNEVCLGCGATL